MPRAWPSFSVAAASFDEGLLDRRLLRHGGVQDLGEPVMQLAKARRQRRFVIGTHSAGADEAERIAEALDDTPTGAPEPRIDADDANRFPHPPSLPSADSDASEM